jgi:pilus assembly protein Flp/PilA
MPFALELLRDRTGATAIEYGLIAALIGATIVFSLSALGTELGNTMNEAQAGMANGNGSV